MRAIYTVLVLLHNIVMQAQVKDIAVNVYKTIKIGSQIWMAENLATSRFKMGITSLLSLKTFDGVSGIYLPGHFILAKKAPGGQII
jgi:hypothetical protein